MLSSRTMGQWAEGESAGESTGESASFLRRMRPPISRQLSNSVRRPEVRTVSVKMRSFLAQDNICAQNLLLLVSHGNAIIAEILRLKNHIPRVYFLENKDMQTKYQDVVLDFSYFRISDVHEKKINNNTKLQDQDDDLKEKYLEIITRFYMVFENVLNYILELNSFIEMVNDEMFIQENMETVMQDVEGKQLLCESLYLYGVMLLFCDLFIPGPVRERLLVAFYRYSANQSQSNVDDVCKLLRDTGYHQSSGKKPLDYPVEYFSRVLPRYDFVEAVIAKLRSEDIYNQLSVYPLPEHRSAALGNQATMLFICLFFAPQYLSDDITKMREIVDKFYPDNWILPIYMGVSISIVDYWEHFKAAKSALLNTSSSKIIKDYSCKYKVLLENDTQKVQNLLQEGVLTDDYLLDNVNKIINLLISANVTVRWLFLHTSNISFLETNKKSKQIKELVIKECQHDPLKLLELLISTSELELKVRESLNKLIHSKIEACNEYKKQTLESLECLSELFSGSKPITKVSENDQLKTFFEKLHEQIEEMGETFSTKSSKKLVQIIQGLDDVEEYHGIKNNSTVMQYLQESKDALRNILRLISLRDSHVVTLETIADLSYAWCSVRAYTGYMQDSIKSQPAVTSRLRALFLKLASAMEIPLLRINQAESEDMESVSQYYSNELVTYIQEVLQVIPATVFNILAKIIELQTWTIKEVPTRLEKEKLRDFAQLEHRFEVAKLTHNASTFTKGILDMKTTLVGVVQIDPSQLLEDGLLKELSTHLNGKLEELLEPNVKKNHSATTLLARLDTLAESMDGYKRSLEYIQDYINVHGLRIWQKQIATIIGESVAKEISLKRGVSLNSPPAGFMGSLARQITQLVDPRACCYIEVAAAWYDMKSHAEIVNSKTFSKLYEAVGAAGLHGLDTLVAHVIRNQLQAVVRAFNSAAKDPFWIEHDEKDDASTVVKDFEQMCTKGGKLVHQIAESLVLVGTLQTLRRHIGYQLNTACKFDSAHLESSLRTMNLALLAEINSNTAQNCLKISPELLQNVKDLLLRCGLYEPFENVYVDKIDDSLRFNPSYIVAAIVINQLPKLQVCQTTGDIVPKKLSDGIDGHSLLIGAFTLLRQFKLDYSDAFINHLCNYHKATLLTKSKAVESLVDNSIIIKLLENFCHLFNYSYDKVLGKLPTAALSVNSK